MSLRAVGNGAAKPSRAEYVATTKNRTVHIDGLPLGTRDGLLVEHYFPADGEYVFNLNVSTEPGAELRAYPRGWLEYRHTAILTIDGVKVFEASLGGEDDLRDLDHLQIVAVERDQGSLQEHSRAGQGRHSRGRRDVHRARPCGVRLPARKAFVPGEGVPDVPQMRGFDVVGPVFADRASARRRGAASGSSCATPRRRPTSCRAPSRSSSRLARLAFRARADARPRSSGCSRSTVAVTTSAASRGASRRACSRSCRARTSCTAASRAARRTASSPAQAYPISDTRARLAARVLPLERGARRGAARPRRGEAARATRPSTTRRSAGCSRDARAESLVTNFASNGSASGLSTPSIPTRSSFRASTRTCGARSRPRCRCSSRASCSTTSAAWSTC